MSALLCNFFSFKTLCKCGLRCWRQRTDGCITVSRQEKCLTSSISEETWNHIDPHRKQSSSNKTKMRSVQCDIHRRSVRTVSFSPPPTVLINKINLNSVHMSVKGQRKGGATFYIFKMDQLACGPLNTLMNWGIFTALAWFIHQITFSYMIGMSFVSVFTLRLSFFSPSGRFLQQQNSAVHITVFILYTLCPWKPRSFPSK